MAMYACLAQNVLTRELECLTGAPDVTGILNSGDVVEVIRTAQTSTGQWRALCDGDDYGGWADMRTPDGEVAVLREVSDSDADTPEAEGTSHPGTRPLVPPATARSRGCWLHSARRACTQADS